MSGSAVLRLKLFVRKNVLLTGIMFLMILPDIVFTQDIIYKTDKTIIEAKVLKISDSEVEYKRFSNPDGPTYSILRKQVKMIIYQNGEKDVFELQVPEPVQQKQEPVQPKTTPLPAVYSVVSYANARTLLLAESINSAIIVYAQLVSKDTANVSLGAEYAFALALGGIYDAALARLDRVWGLEAKNTDPIYYASQVFLLMGFDQLASEFNREQDKVVVPAWVAEKAPVLVQKYKRSKPAVVSGRRDELVTNFKRANSLAAQNANLQSIGVFEEITFQYPDEFLPYVGYSIVLEKAGLYAKSANAIESALKIIRNNADQAETRHFLEKRLVSLKELSNSAVKTDPQQATPLKTAESKQKPVMAYVGGMIYSEYFNINTKIGYLLTDNGNVSVNMGVTSSAGSTYFNLGFLYYQRYKKVLVGGFGLSSNIGNSSATLYMKISPGLSIMNKEKTSSWDIFWDVQMPFSKKYATYIGFSVGKSFYFGNR